MTAFVDHPVESRAGGIKIARLLLDVSLHEGGERSKHMARIFLHQAIGKRADVFFVVLHVGVLKLYVRHRCLAALITLIPVPAVVTGKSQTDNGDAAQRDVTPLIPPSLKLC